MKIISREELNTLKDKTACLLKHFNRRGYCANISDDKNEVKIDPDYIKEKIRIIKNFISG